jgi:integrase/recombinase XerD
MVIFHFCEEIVMLEHYYIRPDTVDRIRSSWIATAIEQYVAWLAAQRYSQSTVLRRVPLLVAFGEFAKRQGVTDVVQLPDHVEPFVHAWMADHAKHKANSRTRKKIGQCVRNPIRQMLCLAIPGYVGLRRPHKPDNPFEAQAPQFLAYLTEEKGLRPRSIKQYRFHLRQFATYLEQVGIKDLSHLSPMVLSGFIAQYGPRVAWPTLRNACGTLRVFLRYLHREGILLKDLSPLVEFPQAYRYAGIPRAISWEQVEQVLAGVDRRSVCGKRDYAMLLLLATYGLRACEVAALTLDDLDWRNDRFKVRDRKAGNTTTYPLSAVVGAAIIDYVKNARPAATDRQVFLRTLAPLAPIGSAAVTCRATHYIRKAGIQVPRAGSHTLRHSCVQQLVNANFSLKHIGDYVGHRNASSTQIYSKIAVEQLREVALGDGEDVL